MSRKLTYASGIATTIAGSLVLGMTARGGAMHEIAAASARAAFWGSVLAVAAVIGARLTRSRLTGLSHVVWDGAAGLPVLIVAWLLVGFLPGGFARAPIAGVLLAAAAMAAVLLFAATREARDAGPPAAGAPGAIALALGIAVAFAGLAWDRVPPVFFDTLAYHFAQPDLWIIERHIQPFTWSIHSWYPPGMSVLYGVGLALGGERLANDANLLAGLLVLGLAWDVGRRRAGAWGGLAALGILASLPITIHALGIPAADLGHGLFAAGALAALSVPAADDDASWRRRAALLAGGAVLTKFLGILAPLGVGAVWLLAGRTRAERDEPAGRRLRRAIAFVVPAMALFAPWLAANAVVTGNPIAPAAAGLIRPAGLATGSTAMFQADARGGVPAAAELRAIPARLFGGAGADSPFYPTPAWGLMPLVLALALPLAPRADRTLDLLALAGITFAIWLCTYRWERFLIAASFLIAVTAGVAITAAARRGGLFRLAPVLALAIAAAAAAESCQRVAAFTGGAPVLLGREDARAFFERAFASPRVVRAAADRLDPRTTRILFVGETRHYGTGLDRAAPTGFNVHPIVEALAVSTEPEAARAALLREGFTHLLVDPGWIRRSGRSYPSLATIVADPAPLDALLASLGQPVAADGGVALYTLGR